MPLQLCTTVIDLRELRPDGLGIFHLQSKSLVHLKTPFALSHDMPRDVARSFQDSQKNRTDSNLIRNKLHYYLCLQIYTTWHNINDFSLQAINVCHSLLKPKDRCAHRVQSMMASYISSPNTWPAKNTENAHFEANGWTTPPELIHDSRANFSSYSSKERMSDTRSKQTLHNLMNVYLEILSNPRAVSNHTPSS